jgi:predicted DCC family thiol-disulfide oxidoreductase YuxK
MDAHGAVRDPELVVFDSECTFCRRAVRFIAGRAADRRLRFAPRGSEDADRALARVCAGGPAPASMLLVDGPRIHARSDAVLRIARRLRFPWNLLGALLVVPRPLRDRLYDWVARNRWRLSGGGACAGDDGRCVT